MLVLIVVHIFFLVLTDTSYLPRYKYHRFLLYWFLEGIPKLPTFQQCHFDESCIIIGGNFNEENKIELFGETTLTEKVTFADLQKGLFKNMYFIKCFEKSHFKYDLIKNKN